MSKNEVSDPIFIVQQVYEYEREYETEEGKKTYIQKVARPTGRTDLEKIFSKKLNSLLIHTTTLNKLNRIRNAIIKNKCYGKTNYIKQINKIEKGGEISETTKNLLYDIGKRSYSIATTIEDSLMELLELFEIEEQKLIKFKEELEALDNGKL